MCIGLEDDYRRQTARCNGARPLSLTNDRHESIVELVIAQVLDGKALSAGRRDSSAAR